MLQERTLKDHLGGSIVSEEEEERRKKLKSAGKKEVFKIQGQGRIMQVIGKLEENRGRVNNEDCWLYSTHDKQ